MENAIELIKVSRCNRELDFKPIRLWPSHLPPIAYQDYLIAGFESQQKEAMICRGDFVELFKDCYANLSLPELTRFYFLAQNKFEIDWSRFFYSYHFKWSEEIKKTLYTVSQCSIPFQQWLAQKQVGPQELAPLNWYFHQYSRIPTAFLQQFTMQMSRNSGVKILELGIELLATNYPLETVLKYSQSPERWLQSLQSLRFPLTHDRDTEWKEKVQAVPWPRQINAQWKREGDHAAIEVKFSFLNAEDFESKIRQLNNIKNKIEGLWNPN